MLFCIVTKSLNLMEIAFEVLHNRWADTSVNLRGRPNSACYTVYREDICFIKMNTKCTSVIILKMSDFFVGAEHLRAGGNFW